MKQKTALTILLMVLAFSMSFTAIACTVNAGPHFNSVQDLDLSQQFALSVPLFIGAGLNGITLPLNQPTRIEIYTFIQNNPGVHFRGICNSLDLSVGVVQYHLNVLVRSGLIVMHEDGQNKRYFEANTYTKSDANVIMLLRHGTTNKILALLAQNDHAIFHKEITKNLLITSQAVTWQMNQLKNMSLVHAEQDGMSIKYTLTETAANLIKPHLNTINQSDF